MQTRQFGLQLSECSEKERESEENVFRVYFIGIIVLNITLKAIFCGLCL